jgi:hypothetical protein
MRTHPVADFGRGFLLDNIIVGGDFNIDVRHGERGRQLNKLMAEVGMAITNTETLGTQVCY